jgi:hypothetical protein
MFSFTEGVESLGGVEKVAARMRRFFRRSTPSVRRAIGVGAAAEIRDDDDVHRVNQSLHLLSAVRDYLREVARVNWRESGVAARRARSHILVTYLRGNPWDARPVKDDEAYEPFKELSRIRECALRGCMKLYWAKRVDSKACSEGCGLKRRVGKHRLGEIAAQLEQEREAHEFEESRRDCEEQLLSYAALLDRQEKYHLDRKEREVKRERESKGNLGDPRVR